MRSTRLPLSWKERGFLLGPAQSLPDAPKRQLGARQDFVVGQAQDIQAARAEPPIPTPVKAGAAEMAWPIHLHHQIRFDAEEVQEVGPERVLSTELRAEAPASEERPERRLGGGRRAT